MKPEPKWPCRRCKKQVAEREIVPTRVGNICESCYREYIPIYEAKMNELVEWVKSGKPPTQEVKRV